MLQLLLTMQVDLCQEEPPSHQASLLPDLSCLSEYAKLALKSIYSLKIAETHHCSCSFSCLLLASCRFLQEGCWHLQTCFCSLIMNHNLQ